MFSKFCCFSNAAVTDASSEAKKAKSSIKPTRIEVAPRETKATVGELQLPKAAKKSEPVVDDYGYELPVKRIKRKKRLKSYPISSSLSVSDPKYVDYRQQFSKDLNESIQSAEDAMELFSFQIGGVKILEVLCGALEKEFELKKGQDSSKQITVYHSESVSEISITKYVWQFAQHTNASGTAFLMMFVILNIMTKEQFFKLSSLEKPFNYTHLTPVEFNPLTAHRLVITSLLVASKIMDDWAAQVLIIDAKQRIYTNNTFAKVGGLSVQELSDMESKMLCTLNHEVPFQAVYFDDVLNALNLKPTVDSPDLVLKNLYELFRKMGGLDEENEMMPVLRFGRSRI